MANLIELTSGLHLEACKLKGLADLIFIKEADGSSSLEEPDTVNGFSMILSDIAERVESLSEEIRTGGKPSRE